MTDKENLKMLIDLKISEFKRLLKSCEESKAVLENPDTLVEKQDSYTYNIKNQQGELLGIVKL